MLYARLAGDEQLTQLLATYDGQPAVFTDDPPPGDAALPYIVTAGHVADTPFDTKDRRGREVWRDIRCYTAHTGSAEPVEAIAGRVFELLHRQPLTVDGVPALVTEVTGPRVGPQENEAASRILTLHVVFDPR